MILIIDGNNLLFRNYHITKNTPSLEGFEEQHKMIHTYFMLNSLSSNIRQFRPDHVITTWDKRLTFPSTNFRKEQADVEYKQNRHCDDLDLIIEQGEITSTMYLYLGVQSMYPNKLEADDVISWLSKNCNDSVVIISSDKDLLQLVSDNTNVYNPIKKIRYTLQNFEEHVGMSIPLFKQWKAISTDTSDNIKGVYGIGKVKFAKNTVNGVFDTSILTEEQLQIYNRNIKLTDLDIGYTIEEGEEECYNQQWKVLKEFNIEPDFDTFFEKCKEYEFNSILDKRNEWISTFTKKDSLVSSINSMLDRLNI